MFTGNESQGTKKNRHAWGHTASVGSEARTQTYLNMQLPSCCG